MKKKALISAALTLFLLTSFSSTLLSQDAKEIYEKMIEAQGGRTSLGNIQDTTLIGYVEMPGMGLGGSMTTYLKEPSMLRTDTKVRGTLITQAYDGETAWMTNPLTGEDEVMPGEMSAGFIRSSLGNDALLNPEKYGIVYTLEGKETIEGNDYYILAQVFPDGFESTLYIDPVTFLTYKTSNTAIDGAGNESVVETVFADYKKVGSVILAHSMTTYQNGEEFMKMEIAEVKFNTNLEDSFFKKKESRGL